MTDRESLVDHIIKLRLMGDEAYAKYAQKWYEDLLHKIYPELRSDVARAWKKLQGATQSGPEPSQ